MTKRVLLFLFALIAPLFAAYGERKIWRSGDIFLDFMQSNSIPHKLYYNLGEKDRELVSEISVGSVYYMIFQGSSKARGELSQILIPLSDDVQLHFYKDKDNKWVLDFIPIIYQERTAVVRFKITHNPYQDALNITRDGVLTNEFVQMFTKGIERSKGLYEGDKISFIYTRRYRLNEGFGSVYIWGVMVENNKSKKYVFSYNEKLYDAYGREVKGFVLDMPLKRYRISSKFSKGRFHPILKVIRPHYGVDLAAPHGTPVLAAASGRVIFSGHKGGYGDVVILRHDGGLKTLYGHLSRRDVKTGQWVKKGVKIGRLGSSGLSTGPHVHFGVYRNGRPIDPLGIVRTLKAQLYGKERRNFLQYTNSIRDILDDDSSQYPSITKLYSPDFVRLEGK